MKIQDELKDGIVIIALEGKVMGGPDATMFHGKLHEYVNAGNKKVIIDLAKVEWMSSVGLGMLISALTTMKNNDGMMKLANVTENIDPVPQRRPCSRHLGRFAGRRAARSRGT